MSDSSSLLKFIIDFSATSNSSKEKMGIDRIECLSSSFGTREFEEENSDPRKLQKSSLSIGHAENWIVAS